MINAEAVNSQPEETPADTLPQRSERDSEAGADAPGLSGSTEHPQALVETAALVKPKLSA